MKIFSGTRPTNLGTKAGRLAPPAMRPNNVSSQADQKADSAHYIAPLKFKGDPAAAFKRLRAILGGWPRATIVADQPEYLHVETASKGFGFVDDNEFLLDRKARVIHVRAAARLGYSDMGANRARIEALRSRFAGG